MKLANFYAFFFSSSGYEGVIRRGGLATNVITSVQNGNEWLASSPGRFTIGD